MKEKPLFIWLLEYGEEKSGTTITCHQVINKACSDKFISDRSTGPSIVLRSLFLECFEYTEADRISARKMLSKHDINSFDSHYSDMSTHLKPEYYFRLLEHRELQLAREAAKQANENAKAAQLTADKSISLAEDSNIQSQRSFRFSVLAVVISVVASIGATFWQLKSPISIEEKQINRLEEAVGRLRIRILDSISSPQAPIETKSKKQSGSDV